MPLVPSRVEHPRCPLNPTPHLTAGAHAAAYAVVLHCSETCMTLTLSASEAQPLYVHSACRLDRHERSFAQQQTTFAKMHKTDATYIH